MKSLIKKDLLEQEYRELVKAKNSWFHFHNTDPSVFITVQENHRKDLDGDLSRVSSVPDEIDYLLRTNTAQAGTHYGDLNLIQRAMDKSRASHKFLSRPAAEYISAIARRMVCIRLLVDKYSLLNEGDVLDSKAVNEAGRIFRRNIRSPIGWQNSINFEVGSPGTMTNYTEQVETYHSGMSRVHWTVTLGVDRSWIQVVQENGIELVDIAQKPYMTLWAEEIEEHELKDRGVRLFQSKIVSTKVPRTMNTYNGQSGDGKRVVLLEDRVIAVQSFESERKPVITTGKNQAWAIRTMKARMKKTMMQMMDL